MTAYAMPLSPTNPQRSCRDADPFPRSAKNPRETEHGSKMNDRRRRKRAASLGVSSCRWRVGNETQHDEL